MIFAGMLFTTVAVAQNATGVKAEAPDSKLAPVTEKKKPVRSSNDVVTPAVLAPVTDLMPEQNVQAKSLEKPAAIYPVGMAIAPDTENDPMRKNQVKQAEYKEIPMARPPLPVVAPLKPEEKKPATNKELPKQVVSGN